MLQNQIAHGFFIVGQCLELIEVEVHHEGHRRNRPEKGEGICKHVTRNESRDKNCITEFRRGIVVFRGTEDPVFRAAHVFTWSQEAGGIDSTAWFVDS